MGWLKVLEVGMAVLAVIALHTAVLDAARSKPTGAEIKGSRPTALKNQILREHTMPESATIKGILVGVDGSVASDATARWGANMQPLCEVRRSL